MKMSCFFNRVVCLAVWAAFPFITGCAGSSLFKNDTEQSILKWSYGDRENAIHYARKALRANSEDVYAMMVAGLSYESLGEKNQARVFYERIVAMQSDEESMLGTEYGLSAKKLKNIAEARLNALNFMQSPLTEIDPKTRMPVFKTTEKDINAPVSKMPTSVRTIRGGLDMLDEADKNVVMRFLTFIRLRDENYVTEEEWQARRTANLGGLLPYTLTPAAAGLDMPAPKAEVIIARLTALRDAVEIRAVTPQEHAAEREIILEALLPENPQYRMKPVPFPQDVLQAATALRRIEMLKNMNLISAQEAGREKAAVEKLLYAKIGMNDKNGQSRPEVTQCIQKCLSVSESSCVPCAPCPAVSTTPVRKKTNSAKATPVKKKTSSTKTTPIKKKTTPEKPKQLCPC